MKSFIELNIRAKDFCVGNKLFNFHNTINKILIFNKNKIIFFLYPADDYHKSPNYEPLLDPNNVYCFDLDGNLVWQGGQYDGNLPEWLYEEPLPFSGKYPHYMGIDGDLIMLTYGIGLGCYRWLNPETGEVVKEEWDKYGR